MYKAIVLIFIIFYCFYNIFSGNRGLIVTLDIEECIAIQQDKLHELERTRAILENKLQGLKPESIDINYLEELAKEKLGFADPQEIVLIIGDLR